VTHLSQCVSLWTIDVKFSVSSSSLQPTIVLSRIYSSYNSFLARTSQISPFYNSWITARFFQEIYLLSLSWRISMSMRVVKDNWSKYTCHADNIQFSTVVNQVYCPCHGSTVRTTLSELVRYIVVPPIFVTLEYLQSKLLIVFVVTYLSQCVSLRTIEVIIPCCALIFNTPKWNQPGIVLSRSYRQYNSFRARTWHEVLTILSRIHSLYNSSRARTLQRITVFSHARIITRVCTGITCLFSWRI
jgi:hypothetical protein